MQRPMRGARWLLGGLAVGLLVAGCTSSSGVPNHPPSGEAPAPDPVAVTRPPAGPLLLDGGDGVELAIQASAAVWASSPVAVTAVADDPESVDGAAARAAELSVPLLVLPPAPEPATSAGPGSTRPDDPDAGSASADPASTGPGAGTARDEVEAELDRLGVTHVLHVGATSPTFTGIEVVSVESDLPRFGGAAPQPDLTALTAPGAAGRGAPAAALASLAAAGADVVELAGTDPREAPGDVGALAGTSPAGVVGVGAGFGDPVAFAQRVEAAATGVQLPGGGQTVFDGKRYVALYGHPLTSALGALGEQGPAATVTRARGLAAGYEPLAEETIVPALEIIATVASGSAGKDKDYSREWDVETLRPLVDRAAQAGIYVVLDLQPGRADFLTQAKLYEELLREPHVGLAMDPEWRLKPHQVHLRQIGSVSSAEVNTVLDWLAELTDAHDLPQKLVVLHQFLPSMIADRKDLHLDHDELAVLVQMDGDGTLGQKLATWRALRADAPKGLRFGWKNFYDEDEPTPSPRTTFEVQPTPWWVSYQ
jgi:hypothetical protein